MLSDQDFVAIYAHASKLQPEGSGVRDLRPDNMNCPQCQGIWAVANGAIGLRWPKSGAWELFRPRP